MKSPTAMEIANWTLAL